VERFPDVCDIPRIKLFVLYIYEKQGFSSNRKAINLVRCAAMPEEEILQAVYKDPGISERVSE